MVSSPLRPVDLDHLIAEVDRNAPSSDDVDRVRTAAQLAGELQAAADDLVAHFVELARNNSRSWADVGEALGVTRQAAMQRFVAPVKESALPPDGEVQEAFRAAKEIAIRHRHNFIGTEHLLLGLLDADNAATRVLAAAAVPADGLRHDLESRMSLGGSQAAARIPWTPYARKCADLAEQHAAKAGRAEVGTVDWLAALLELGRGAAADALRSHGVTTVDAPPRPSAGKKTRSRSA
jgi:hypothetical protein